MDMPCKLIGHQRRARRGPAAEPHACPEDSRAAEERGRQQTDTEGSERVSYSTQMNSHGMVYAASRLVRCSTRHLAGSRAPRQRQWGTATARPSTPSIRYSSTRASGSSRTARTASCPTLASAPAAVSARSQRRTRRDPRATRGAR